ncbi:MAG: peptidoglycan DD-metalloendopeptidase family protein [Clostridia bacterium]|nr:peptidoglycan DD-metalloendopeptidase family protein [Clostridia bacterium]
MYERGSLSVLTVLFSADSFSDLLKRAELISQIAAYDDAVMERMEKAQAEIQAKKQVLEEANTITKLNRDIQQNKKAELDAKKASLDSAMSALTADENAYRAALDEADAAEEALRAEIQALTNPSLGGTTTPPKYSGGKFCWPTPSTTYITSPFGTRYHPIQKRNKTHTGIDIGAGHGASILAAEAGTVLRADWNSGYGNYVVIDHGGGVQTLYGHCSALLVKSGQTVSRGQQIALVGSTGVSTGPHLHFEVLINGSYTDPMAYFD